MYAASAASIAVLALGLMACSAEPPEHPVTAIYCPYLVFFDFDKSTITPQAASTIKEVANAATASGRVHGIELRSHTDRAGDEQYNMRLSIARGDAVKAELIRNGIPGDRITVIGEGESRPMVMTADGVREPQNRYVRFRID
jgi:OOP family OmpA-OmpF porin